MQSRRMIVGLGIALVVTIAACEGGQVGGRSDANLTDGTDPGLDGSLDAAVADEGVGPVRCAEPGAACDDGDPCTVNDVCDPDRICRGTAVAGCDDGLDCTHDGCADLDHCTHDLKPGFCLVEGVCYRDGDASNDNPCWTCQTALATDALLPDDSRTCDDGNACTRADRCVAGQCVAGPVDCDDHNPCTEDSCAVGECVHTPVDGPCMDGDRCTSGDRCQNGICRGEPVDCDDQNDCTTDACRSDAGCVHEPKADGTPCQDDNFCTVGDACEGGVCRPGAGRLECDDQNPCTDDGCVPAKGCVFLPNSRPCDDGDPCTLGDTCRKGVCEPGTLPLDCEDGNVCTDDACVPGAGCAHAFNHAPCDDQEPCRIDDHCEGGLCVPGPTPLDCDDQNPCTTDSCVEGIGCAHANNEDLCDDGNLCTEADVCSGGTCAGTPVPCDDGNDCTVDSCDPAIGCVQEPDMTKPECRPQITILWPPRAATLNGNRALTIQGTVTSNAGFIVSLSLDFNGEVTPLLPNPLDGSFAVPVTSAQGINTIVVDASDQYGRKDHVVQSYYYSTEWYAVDASNPAQSMVRDGLMVFLGPEVWDDNDPSDVDDLATIMGLFVKNLDINSMIQNPIATGSFGWCDYEVNLGTVTFNQNDLPIDLTPVNGGLKIQATIKNLQAPFSARLSGFLCNIGNTDGTVTVDWITIEATLSISVNAAGEPVVTATNTTVTMSDPKVSVDNFLVDILKGFFLGSLKDQLKNAFEDQLGPTLEKTVADALKALALDQDISVPPLMAGGTPLVLKLRTRFSSIAFTPAGGAIGFYATVVVPKGVPHDPLGSIGRAACLTGQPEVFVFPMHGPLELALHDDFFNQIPYGLYWGGGLRFPLTAEQLGQDLSQYGVTDLNLFLDFLLPPILSSCRGDGKLYLEIGDLSILANMKLFGMPIEAQLYASIVVEAQVAAVQTPDGAEIGIQVGEPVFLDLEVASLTGGLAGGEETLGALLKETFLPMVLDSFTKGAFGSFPVPDIDLSGMAPGLPPGASISLDLQEVLRVFGYTVLSGRVK